MTQSPTHSAAPEPAPQRLSSLLTGLSYESIQNTQTEALRIDRVTSDSREAAPGVLFVAVKGTQVDGHAFISQVQAAGASLIVGELPPPNNLTVPYLQVPDSRRALALIAANFYGNPSHQMLMIGVTGTSGKTTTTYLIESILVEASHHVGVIGTVNFRHGKARQPKKELPSSHTTPGPVELQRLLYQMKHEGCTAVVMEVSSHALKQHRAAYIAFDAMAFTNLSPEHLDYHPDMEDYFLSKRMLFTEYADVSLKLDKDPALAINADDSYGQRLYSELKKSTQTRVRLFAFGMKEDSPLGVKNDLSGQWLKVTLNGIQGHAGSIQLSSPLIGSFNVENILCAAAVGRGLGLAPGIISLGIDEVHLVPGRLERVPNPSGITVIVDYAHKPDALEKVLKTLRDLKEKNRLITVVGCGGDRDRTKRPVMGRLAVELSDQAIITSDNPRTEKPEAIIEEMLKGILGSENFLVEADRKKAIFKAIELAQPGDLVLIAGKGHEDYQILSDPAQPGKTRKIHFDDREVALEALKSRFGDFRS